MSFNTKANQGQQAVDLVKRVMAVTGKGVPNQVWINTDGSVGNGTIVASAFSCPIFADNTITDGHLKYRYRAGDALTDILVS